MKLVKAVFISVGVFFLFLVCSSSYADSPVGNCELYKYGMENPLVKEAKDVGVLSDEMLTFIDDQSVSLTQKIFLLNAVVEEYPTILNTAILAKHWGTTYRDIFKGDQSLSEEKRFLLAISALFQETTSPDNHLKVLKNITGDFSKRPEYKAIVAIAEGQVAVVDGGDQCEVFPEFKKKIQQFQNDLGILGEALIKEIDDYMKYCDDSASIKGVRSLFDFLFGIGDAHAQEVLEPRLIDGGAIDVEKIKDEFDQEVDMSESGGSLELACGECFSENEDKQEVKTCNQFFEMLDQGCSACTTYDITMQSWFIHACEPKKGLLKAQTSKVSYVKDLLSLPAEEIVYRIDLTDFVAVSGEEQDAYEIAREKGIHWMDLIYDLEVKKEEDGGISMESQADNFTMYLDFVAFGDVNTDGVEDVNVNVTFHLIQGTYRWYDSVWFSADQEGGFLKTVKKGFDSEVFLNQKISSAERPDVIRTDTLRESLDVGDYKVRIFRDWDVGTHGVVQVYNDQFLFEDQGHKFSLGASDGDMSLDNSPEQGIDITGDGKPNLLISHWSGGAHCCFDVLVFSLEDKPKLLDVIRGEHGFEGFKDLNNDGIFEFVGYDWTFAYWNECFAGSPSPEVVLSFKDGKYRMNMDLMSKPPIKDDVYYKAIEEHKEWTEQACAEDTPFSVWKYGDVCVASPLWGHMLELIYTDNSSEAWSFLDRVWKGNEDSKKKFIEDFKTRLGLSDYAGQLPLDLAKYIPDPAKGLDGREIRDKEDVEQFMKAAESIKEIIEKN